MDIKKYKKFREYLQSIGINDDVTLNDEVILEAIKAFESNEKSKENIEVEPVKEESESNLRIEDKLDEVKKPRVGHLQGSVVVTFKLTYEEVLKELDFRLRSRANNGTEFRIACLFGDLARDMIELLDERKRVFFVKTLFERVDALKLDESCISFLDLLGKLYNVDIYGLPTARRY